MTQPADFAAVESLLEERNALREWLSRLADRSHAAPEGVRQRVRGDYQARLDGVDARLRKHANAIAGRLAEDRAEHDDLMARSQVVRDALAEAELRHAVGEYDAERFEAERVRHVAELEQFEASIGAVSERVARLEDVHAMIVREPAVEASPARQESEHAVVEPELTVVEPEPEAPPTSVNVEAGEALPLVEIGDLGLGTPSADVEPAMDDLLSIFDAAEAAEVAERREAPRLDPPAERSPPIRLAEQGPLSFTPSGGPEPVQPRQVVPPGAPTLGMSGADLPPRFVRPAEGRGSELVEAPSRHHHAAPQPQQQVTVIPDPEPVLPEVAADATEPAARTLRCAECGAMNRPLEWYCEKCGAELTAL